MGSVRRDIKVHIRISSYQCGGVLLNHWYVATAAHCVHQAKLDKITVHLGEFDTKNNERVAMAPVSQEVARHRHTSGAGVGSDRSVRLVRLEILQEKATQRWKEEEQGGKGRGGGQQIQMPEDRPHRTTAIGDLVAPNHWGRCT